MCVTKEDVDTTIKLYNIIYDKMVRIVNAVFEQHPFFQGERGRYSAWPGWHPSENKWVVEWSWYGGHGHQGQDEGRFHITTQTLALSDEDAVLSVSQQITEQLDEEKMADEERQAMRKEEDLAMRKAELEAEGFKVTRDV